MENLLTVFTPTYNRAYTINKCYESLRNQSCKDFEWLIIDDGSTDNTKELIEKWIKENNDFKIRYIYQENQGMHGAHNTAYENIHTELNVCIDSDDYMPNDAVEKIKNAWEKVKDNKKIAGLIGLDAYEGGKIIGDKLPNNVKVDTLFNLSYNRGITGDKKLVYRTELIKKYPYPIYAGEKYVGLAYKYYKLDQDNGYILSNKNDIYDIINYDYMDINNIKEYIKTSNNDNGIYKVKISDIILNSSSSDYITIKLDNINNTIEIDYTNLLRINDNNITKAIVTITYSNINKLNSLEE